MVFVDGIRRYELRIRKIFYNLGPDQGWCGASPASPIFMRGKK
jgi:hypothetical protein